MSQRPSLTIGALGDSISVAFNAEASGDNAAHSWTTGDRDLEAGASHLTRLRRLFPALDVRAVNVAVAGARATDLAAQAERLLPWQPDYVTLLIGANDLTDWLTGDYRSRLLAFEANVQATVRRLVAGNPRLMLLVVAIPDQARIVSLLAGRRFGAEIQAYLNSLTDNPQLKAVMAIYRERWTAMNQVLERVSREHPANARFAPSAAGAAFTGEHLSPLDSYHPSVAGQRLLADVTWGDGFFP